MKSGQRLLAAICLGTVVAAGGCNRTLFTEADPYYQERIRKYWDGDSAERLSAERAKAGESGMGFGFPTGMASQ